MSHKRFARPTAKHKKTIEAESTVPSLLLGSFAGHRTVFLLRLNVEIELIIASVCFLQLLYTLIRTLAKV